MVRLTRRVFSTTALAFGLAGHAHAEEPERGGTLVATYGGGEPQACYVPSGGGPHRRQASTDRWRRAPESTVQAPPYSMNPPHSTCPTRAR